MYLNIFNDRQASRLAKNEANEDHVGQAAGVRFVAGEEVIGSYLRQPDLTGQEAFCGCRKS